MRDAQEAQASGTRPDFCATGQPGWCLGLVLAAAGEPERGAGVMLEAVGGPDLTSVVAAERPTAAADLAEMLLACGRLDDAGRVLASGQAAAVRAGTDWAALTAGRGRAAVLLAKGQAQAAVEAAAEAIDQGAHAGTVVGRSRAASSRPGAGRGGRPAVGDRGADRRRVDARAVWRCALAR